MTKVLIVEDNDMGRDMLSRRLQRKGYNVVTAVDGIDGLSAVASEQPDIVLMDLVLPGMDGWTVTRHLKSAPQQQNIPVIALSAYVTPGDYERALASGCDDYDTKPVELPRLVDKMEMLLSQFAFA